MAKAKKSEGISQKAVSSSPDVLYVLEVFLIDGPITEEFAAQNPVVSPTIEIKGSNTLALLHQIIFKAVCVAN